MIARNASCLQLLHMLKHVPLARSTKDRQPGCAWQHPHFLEHCSSWIAALQVLGCFACALECCHRGSSWTQLINISRLWWNCARPIFNQVRACKRYTTRISSCDTLTCNLHVKTRHDLLTLSSIHGLQVPILTQPTAKATWQVDTPPAAEAPLPPGKAGAGKAGAGKPGVQAPKAATPTDSGPLPSDALDEDFPSGPVRYSVAKR